MVAQMEDMDAKELKELTALLRERYLPEMGRRPPPDRAQSRR